MTAEDTPTTALLDLDDLRQAGAWAADCAERALPVFEAWSAADPRPREALAGIRAFAAGGKRSAQLRAQAWGANAAGREAGAPAAAAAARAACLAAAVAYTHPLASPHQVRHILGPAVYAAHALALADRNEGSGTDAIRLAAASAGPAVRRLVARLPAHPPGRGEVGRLFALLDAALRA